MPNTILRKLLLATIPILLAGSLSGCAIFGWNTVTYLSSRDKIYIVPSGTELTVIEAGKEKRIKTDAEMALLDRGKFLDLQKEANENLLK